MTTLTVPTRAWSTFAWVCLAADLKDKGRVIDHVKLIYTPALEVDGDIMTAPTLTMLATDRFRVHRVIVDLPAALNAEPNQEEWVIPAAVIIDAAKQTSVGKSSEPSTPLTIADFGMRLEAGHAGWGANFPAFTQNYPPVEKLLTDNPTDLKVGPVTIRAQFLSDLDRYTIGGKKDPVSNVWTFTWNESANPNKPGPIFAHRNVDGIAAAALIQPNLLQ